MLFTDVMTVFNHYKTPNGDAWKRTIVPGVQWAHNRIETTVSQSALIPTRVESITIDFGTRRTSDNYVDPITFSKMPDKGNKWTLDTRNGLDICVLGAVYKDLDSSYTIKDLRNDFQYLGTVSAVSDNRNRTFLKNIKVVVK